MDGVYLFRLFRMAWIGPDLTRFSIASLNSWPESVWYIPGWHTAVCYRGRSPSHEAPVKGCHCGFWGTYDLGLDPPQGVFFFDEGGGLYTSNVAGVIEVSGRVVVGTRAARARRARAVALSVAEMETETARIRPQLESIAPLVSPETLISEWKWSGRVEESAERLVRAALSGDGEVSFGEEVSSAGERR